MYVYSWIKNQLASQHNLPVDEVDTDEMEEVWFYIITQGWDAGMSRIRRAEGL